MLPENTFRHIGHMIGLIERVSRSYADEYLKELGLSRGQIPYLMVLTKASAKIFWPKDW